MRWLTVSLFVIAVGLPIAHASPRIDVAFVVDATGSMGPYIQQARARIHEIAKDLASGEPAPVVRFALVRYRDVGSSFLTQTEDFTDRAEVMAKWLADTHPKGGGDRPEAVLEGLEIAIEQLSWSSTPKVVRLIYLVGDAPPKFRTGGPTVRSIAQKALHRGIVIHTIACGGHPQREVAHFESLARLSEGRLFTLHKQQATRIEKTTDEADATLDFGNLVKRSLHAYSQTLGVRFTEREVELTPLANTFGSAIEPSGLLGAHVRYVTDLTRWSDVWRAHTSVWRTPQHAVPAHHFSEADLVVLGGQDRGVVLVRAVDRPDRRVLFVRPGSPGVRFIRLVPSKAPIIIQWLEGEKS
ncbi:MAG: vWA domain-containing protein [Myxococcota bacterium]|nr:vWA domain-containing protein [Myxococcota bacterium]